MDTRSWESSANRYYAFSGEKLDFPQRISKTPPPPSTRHSRSPRSATYIRKSAPTSPIFRSSALPKLSLLDRISPKDYSPRSRLTRELPPLSPELGDYLDSQMNEEEEEQVIRVLDNNQELVYQRDFVPDEGQDVNGDPHESRNASPVKKRKLTHSNQPTSAPALQFSPTQNKLNLRTMHNRSKSKTPPVSELIDSPPSKNQPLASRLGVDWSSGSPVKSSSHFGKMSGLTFGFAGYGYDASDHAVPLRETTSRNHVEAPSIPESSQDDDLLLDMKNLCQAGDRTDVPTSLPTPAATQDQYKSTRKKSKGEGEISNGGTSSSSPIGSHRPISDPELEVPLGGGEDHDLGHEANHEEEELNGCNESPVVVPPLIPPRSEDAHMDYPAPLRESPLRSPELEDLPEAIAPYESVPSSKRPTPPGSRTPPVRAEGVNDGIKTIEQHAEDLLHDIHKEYLSKTEAQATLPPTHLQGVLSGHLEEVSISPPQRYGHSRISSTHILGGISPLIGTRSISPILDADHQITSDAVSAYTHTPRSTIINLPITRSTSGLCHNDALFEVDPELDQLTKQALGDLIVHSLKLSHNLDVNDTVRRAIKFEVDEHATDFLKLATRLAKRLDMMGEPLQSDVQVQDIERNQLLSEPVLPGTAETEYLEYLPPTEDSEEDDQRVVSDEGMNPVPPEVSRSDPEDEVRVEPNVEPAGEQKLDDEPVAGHVERVDHTERGDEDDAQESGLEIPGVWCARTGKDRTDTLQEHIEVSEVLAARVKKWIKKNGAPGDKPGCGPVMMNLMCLQTSVMQELYASFEDDARPVEDFFTALKALKCTWPTGGKLMIQVKSGEPERTRTWFSHQLVQGKPLDISSVIHPGRVTLQFVQLADLSNYVFLLLVSEPTLGPVSPRKASGAGGGVGSESKSKVDKYLSTLEFTSSSSSS